MDRRIINADFHTTRRVRRADTNAFGWVHLESFVRIMEETEYEFLRSHGLSVVMQDQRGVIGFPRIATEIQVFSSASLDDELDVWLEVRRNDGVKIEYRFNVELRSRLVASGDFSLACCRFPVEGPPTAILIPDFFQDRFPRR